MCSLSVNTLIIHYQQFLTNGSHFAMIYIIIGQLPLLQVNYLKADFQVGWPNIFKKCFRIIFSLKKKTIQFPLSFNLYFPRKRAPKLSICHLPTKQSVWTFNVTNRATNGFYNFQNYHQVVIYLFNSSAKSFMLFWKYSSNNSYSKE